MKLPKKLNITKSECDAHLSELSRGVSKAFENAQELFCEAVLLCSHGALSRALFLHQISMEECGKIEILGATAVSLLAGYDTNLKKVMSTIAKHQAKNHANAYLLPMTEEEKDASRSGDWKRALDAFKQHQSSFHLHSNTAKNASLYVDVSNSRFVSPKEVITQEMVAEYAERNRHFLALSETKVRMLARWLTDTDEVRKMVTWFLKRAEELKSMDPDPQKVMSMLMDEMLAQAMASNYHHVALGETKDHKAPSTE